MAVHHHRVAAGHNHPAALLHFVGVPLAGHRNSVAGVAGHRNSAAVAAARHHSHPAVGAARHHSHPAAVGAAVAGVVARHSSVAAALADLGGFHHTHPVGEGAPVPVVEGGQLGLRHKLVVVGVADYSRLEGATKEKPKHIPL